METTLAQAAWLLELDLGAKLTYPTGFWANLSKGSTVYLISRQWLQTFREKVFAALAQWEALDCTDCPLTNADLMIRDETGQNRWQEGDALDLSVVVSESVYLKLFHSFVFDPEEEIKGWVMWGPSFEFRFITPRINITYLIQIDGSVYSHGTLSFYENVTISKLMDSLYSKESYLMSQLTKHAKLWNMKWTWGLDQIMHELEAKKGKVSSVADPIDETQFEMQVLQVLQTLTIILRDKKNSIFHSIPFLSRGKKRKDQSAVGLKNLGNTCFLNSILQTLAHIPDLAMYYYKLNPSDLDKPMTTSLANLIKDIYGNQAGVVQPLELRDALTDSNDMYRGSEQQDAEELMLRLLSELIQEEGKEIMGMEYISRTQKSQSLTAWISHISSQYSLILALFTGLMRLTVTCTKCTKSTVTYSPFLSLPLNLCPSKLYTILLIDYEPEMLQTTFRLETQTPFEQQESIMSIWNAITETAHIRNFLIGEVNNHLFSGPLGLSNVPSSQVLMVLRLPDACALDTMVVIFDVFTLERGDHMSVGTKILCCDVGMGIERLKLKIVEHLKTAGNSYFDTLDFFWQLKLGRVSDKDVCEMMTSCMIEMQVPSLETGEAENLSLEQIQVKYKVNQVSQLKGLSYFGEIRVLCAFPILPKIILTTLSSFREETGNSIENYSEKMLTVTLHQLIEYNLRPKPMNEEDLTLCSECKCKSQHILDQGVERFPKVLVFPLQRVRMSRGQVFKSGMEVCFPSTDLDLSIFESGPMYSRPRYDLTAVIRHRGKGVSRGHYMTYAKHPLNGKWYCCNDSKCESVSESEVLRVTEAYMLVYLRK